MSTTPQEHDKAGWLLYHSVGMFPGQQAAMRAALEGFTTSWCRPGLQRWDDGLAARRRCWTCMRACCARQPTRSTRPRT